MTDAAAPYSVPHEFPKNGCSMHASSPGRTHGMQPIKAAQAFISDVHMSARSLLHLRLDGRLGAALGGQVQQRVQARKRVHYRLS